MITCLPDWCFDQQSYGRISVTELLQVEKFEKLLVKASDLHSHRNKQAAALKI